MGCLGCFVFSLFGLSCVLVRSARVRFVVLWLLGLVVLLFVWCALRVVGVVSLLVGCCCGSCLLLLGVAVVLCCSVWWGFGFVFVVLSCPVYPV